MASHTVSISCPLGLKNPVDVRIHPVTDSDDERVHSQSTVHTFVTNASVIAKPPPSNAASAKPVTEPEAHAPAAVSIPTNWQITPVDKVLDPTHTPVTISTPPAPPLGVLSAFTGNFSGPGFNTIFRPLNVGSDKFPNPVNGPPPPTAPNENVLELNLTEETLTFSTPLGCVPNRGLIKQRDIFLNGVPYVQSVSDVTNVISGKADGVPNGIHFEPGLWMHVPSTSDDPVLPESYARMASIPHGTTINAQCLNSAVVTAGPPTIAPVSITPFPIGASQQSSPIRFAAQNAKDINTPRIPQDLGKFIDARTITQELLDNPNLKLTQDNVGKNIISTSTLVITTNSNIGTSNTQTPGTANINFLKGDAGGPNADAALMTSVFWIETVQHEVLIPAHTPPQITTKPQNEPQPTQIPSTGPLIPRFEVIIPPTHTAEKKCTVTYTQIQYSQTVLLNFASLSWPHVSVATLIPSDAVKIPASVFN